MRKAAARAIAMRSCLVSAALILARASAASAANEARCAALGANCQCSEPMNTDSFSNPNGITWAWDPADTSASDKQCATSGVPGGIIESNAKRFYGTNTGPIMTALPAGHRLSFVGRNPAGPTGLFNIGHQFEAATPSARRAVRMYLYFSDDFAFTNDGPTACSNSGKIYQVSLEGPIITVDGRWHAHAFNSPPWSHYSSTFDCCWYGPGDDRKTRDVSNGVYRGKWWRMEVIFRNVGRTPTSLEFYIKNVTDNGPEYKVIDTRIPTAQPVGSDWSQGNAENLSRPAWDWSVFDLFRNDAGGTTCAGYFGWTHYLAASWVVDAGQRIGPAIEIEGGGSTLAASPARPKNLAIK